MNLKEKFLNKEYIDVSILIIWFLIILSDLFSKIFSFTFQGIIILYVISPFLCKEKVTYPKLVLGGIILSTIAVIQSLVMK